MAVRLYLIRHGETQWSLSGQHTGRTDLPLTAHGADEARELLPRLTRIQFSRVFTSPLQRARQTCILAGLGDGAQVEPDLAEWDYGDYEGRLSRDIRKERPGWDVFRDGCPSGEMPDQIAGRADRVIARVCTLDGNIALFSHGQFLRVLTMRWISLSVNEARHFSLGTASLSVLGVDPSHPDVRSVDLWNASAAP